MKYKPRVILAWLLFAFSVVAASTEAIVWLFQLTALPAPSDLVQVFVWDLALPVVFSGLGALIITRQPANRVGWLMILPAISGAVSAVLIHNLPSAPQTLTLCLWLIVWYDGWSWIPVIFPILLIPLYFPTGRPPSPRWGWVNRLAAGMWLFFVVITAFFDTFSPLNGEWSLPNPIGFIPLTEEVERPFLFVWSIGLVTIISLSVTSLFIRYRRAQSGERQQIKWLLYAGALFAVVYILSVLFASTVDTGWALSPLLDLAFVLSILAIPVAIALAILRYRLYDIDIIIRRTLQYTLLTGLLLLTYFGSIALIQNLFFRNQQSEIAIVISTIAIAALFNPLRRRVQVLIDRRFYRQKYDAEQVLAAFSTTLRDEMDLERLTNTIQRVVEENIQPEHSSLWLRKAGFQGGKRQSD